MAVYCLVVCLLTYSRHPHDPRTEHPTSVFLGMLLRKPTSAWSAQAALNTGAGNASSCRIPARHKNVRGMMKTGQSVLVLTRTTRERCPGICNEKLWRYHGQCCCGDNRPVCVFVVHLRLRSQVVCTIGG
jgi:hypothetical protein